jgi:hypothetical protein
MTKTSGLLSGVFATLCIAFWWWMLNGDFTFMHTPGPSNNNLPGALFFLGSFVFGFICGIAGLVLWSFRPRTRPWYWAYCWGALTIVILHFTGHHIQLTNSFQWIRLVIMFFSLSAAMDLFLSILVPSYIRQRV